MLSAIYQIKCLSNNKIYVGSSKNYKNRWITHKRNLNNNKHINKHLQAAWNKYGKLNFIFEIIELCEINNLLDRETYWINKLNSFNREFGFNMSHYSHYYDVSKEYVVISPEGKEFNVKNLEKFCIENNLEKSSLHKVANGELYQSKGWYCRHIKDTHEDWLKKRKRSHKHGHGWKGGYKITYKDGRVFYTKSLNGFARENNYSQGTLHKVMTGLQRTVYGIIKIEKCEL